jgi:hypothetical protein
MTISLVGLCSYSLRKITLVYVERLGCWRRKRLDDRARTMALGGLLRRGRACRTCPVLDACGEGSLLFDWVGLAGPIAAAALLCGNCGCSCSEAGKPLLLLPLLLLANEIPWGRLWPLVDVLLGTPSESAEVGRWIVSPFTCVL